MQRENYSREIDHDFLFVFVSKSNIFIYYNQIFTNVYKYKKLIRIFLDNSIISQSKFLQKKKSIETLSNNFKIVQPEFQTCVLKLNVRVINGLPTH